MKITIDENINNDEEIIIKCSKIDEKILKIVSLLESNSTNILLNKDGELIKSDINKILYFESVDKKTFAYTNNEVYEIALRLYEIEEKYSHLDFFRASKSFIVNLAKASSIKPILGGRLELLLENKEKIVVSRKYVKSLKHILDTRRD